ncbi:MAG: UDP-N-acetylmuramate--L-alanine ligase, partial [Muribaculaceae bacterium]|nr:UDP-N-acetylmuramate--L-alanine ligase [Muribaculaceae bacterium]
VLLLPIYPARELPMPGVSSQLILDGVTAPLRRIVERGQVVDSLRELRPEVLLCVGAGDVNLLLPEITAALR